MKAFVFKQVLFWIAVVALAIWITPLAHAADVVTAPDTLDKAVAYTKQFVAAAMPVAKQAYAIGLLTLQIDAASDIGGLLLALVCVIGVGMWWHKAWTRSLHTWPERATYNFDQSNAIVWRMGGKIACGLVSLILLFNLCNIWMWVKLTHPDLWLAHAAIEKVVAVAAK